uniref:Uncharacterized protein n=1 Tax=Salix viminalis TaxID=40686 RepID=A0A6N2LE45_SALVM
MMMKSCINCWKLGKMQGDSSMNDNEQPIIPGAATMPAMPWIAITSKAIRSAQVFVGCIEEANRKYDMLQSWLQSNQPESDETSTLQSSLSGSPAAVVRTNNQRDGDGKEETKTVR